MRLMDDEFGVWGMGDGSGLVIRSDEPVDFHPINKTANVVQVRVAQGRAQVRQRRHADGRCLSAGATGRITRRPRERRRTAYRAAGRRRRASIGAPHDAMYVMHRFVHWIVVHEDGFEAK